MSSILLICQRQLIPTCKPGKYSFHFYPIIFTAYVQMQNNKSCVRAFVELDENPISYQSHQCSTRAKTTVFYVDFVDLSYFRWRRNLWNTNFETILEVKIASSTIYITWQRGETSNTMDLFIQIFHIFSCCYLIVLEQRCLTVPVVHCCVIKILW